MYPEAGGSSSFARHAFNEFVSFFAGWALSLDYILTIAISAFFVPHYLSAFWPALEHPPGDVIGGLIVVAVLAWLNIRGIGESAKLNFILAILDLATQVLIIIDRRIPGAQPLAARQPGPSWDGADVLASDLRAVAGDARLHRDRDRLEHGRGGARSGHGCPQSREPDPDRRARRVRRHDRRGPVGASGPRARRTLVHAAGARLQPRRLPERPGARDHPAPRAERHGPPHPRLLRGDPRRDDPVHRHQRRADRDLAAVVVAGRAPSAAGDLFAAASALPDAVVHDHHVLGDCRDRADPGPDQLPRQPLLVRRDAVVHDRARVGDRAPDQGSRARTATYRIAMATSAFPRSPDPNHGGARRDRRRSLPGSR